MLLAETAAAISVLPDRDDEVEHALAWFATLPEGARLNTDPLAGIAASRLAYRGGDVAGAEDHLTVAVQRARWRDAGIWEVLAVREWGAQQGPSASVRDRLTELADRAAHGGQEAAMLRLFAQEADARLAGDAASLDGLSRQAEELGAVGVAWEIAAAGQQAHRAGGDDANALRAEQRVARLGGQLPGQWSAVVDGIEPVLSARERSVAEAVAGGMTSREVGDALFVSPRTVQRHLERIFARLGIHDRATLAAIINGEPRAESRNDGMLVGS